MNVVLIVKTVWVDPFLNSCDQSAEQAALAVLPRAFIHMMADTPLRRETKDD